MRTQAQAEELANSEDGLGSRMFKMMFGARSARSLYPIPAEDGWHYEPVPVRPPEHP